MVYCSQQIVRRSYGIVDSERYCAADMLISAVNYVPAQYLYDVTGVSFSGVEMKPHSPCRLSDWMDLVAQWRIGPLVASRAGPRGCRGAQNHAQSAAKHQRRRQFPRDCDLPRAHNITS